MVGAGPPPLWGRGRQGRNTVAAETGSLRLEFPSCYGPELRNPQQLCLTRQLLQSPSFSSHPAWPLPPAPPSSQAPPPARIQTHTAHGCPRAQHSGQNPWRKESQTHPGSLPSHMLLGPERTPNAQSPSCDQLPLACGSQLYPTFHPGSAHFRDGNTDLKVAKLGQDQPDSSDLAQLGREWRGGGVEGAKGLGASSSPPGRSRRAASEGALQSLCLESLWPCPQELFLVNDLPALTHQPTLEGLGEAGLEGRAWTEQGSGLPGVRSNPGPIPPHPC